MAFSTEELIQIGLLVAIIIVFGYTAYNYLKNKGLLERKSTPKKEETKSLSFASNRKMRNLEKLIPDKKLSSRPRLTELKIESTEGLWEPEAEPQTFSKKFDQKQLLEKVLSKTTFTKGVTKSTGQARTENIEEIKGKKEGINEIQQMVKKAGEQKSFLQKLQEKIKTEKQPQAFSKKSEPQKIKPETKKELKEAKGKFAFKPKDKKPEEKTKLLSLDKKIDEVQKEKEPKGLLEKLGLKKARKTEEKPIQKPEPKKAELQAKPEVKQTKTEIQKPKTEIKQALKSAAKEKPEEEKIILERIPIDKLKNYISKGRFAFKRKEDKKEPIQAKQPFKEKTEVPAEKPDIGKKLEDKIKQYEERMKKVKEGKTKDKVLFESKEEKEKHEQKFVQKILDSEEDELEKISKAIEPKTDKKWEQEKKETIEALKKEFSELEKKDEKDLWKQEPKKHATEQKMKPFSTTAKTEQMKSEPKKEVKTILKPVKPKNPLKEFVSNGKFAFSQEKNKPSEEKIKWGEKKQISKQVMRKQPEKKEEKKQTEKPKPETKSSIQEEMKKLMEERKKLVEKEAETRKAQKPVPKQIIKPAPIPKPQLKPIEKPKPVIKPKSEVKPKTEQKKKKGLFERMGLKKEKINFTKEEEDQVQKIMIVLKGKTSEYSREEMKEAMHNLGYKEKIIEEAIRRLYG